MITNSAIKTVAVVGDPFIGWTAATMLSVMLEPMGVKIKFIAYSTADTSTDSDICSSNCFLSQYYLLNILGVSIEDFIQKCGAGFRVGDQYRSETNPGIDFIQSFSGSALAFGRVSLQEIIARLNNNGLPILTEDLAREVQKALTGKPISPAGKVLNRDNLSVIGVNFYKSAFIKLFEENKHKLSIESLTSKFVCPVVATNGSIAHIETDAGSIHADLYLDCTGNQRRLIGALSQTDVLGHLWLDKAIISSSLTHSLPVSRYTFAHNSITKDVSLLHGVESSRFFINIPTATPTLAKMTFARAHRPWVDNCIAVGNALANLGSFAIHEIDLVQQTIPFLVELFPRQGAMSRLANYFNHVVRDQIDCYWDFTYLMLHSDALLQADAIPNDSTMSTPLRKRLMVYQSTARILVSDYEVLSEAYWSSYLLGWQWRPTSWSVDCDLLDINEVYSRLISERLEIQKAL